MITTVAASMMHDELGLARRAAVALALVIGCGPTTSLDEAGPSASSSGTSALASSGSAGLTGSAEGETPPDLLRADLPPLPPTDGQCPPGCAIDLPLVWAWDDEPSRDARLSAMIRAHDGSWFLATQREGQSWITQLDPQGALVRSEPIWLGCDCEIIDLALYPSGEIGVLGEGFFDGFYSVLTLGRFHEDPTPLFEQTWDIIDGIPSRPGRVGALLISSNDSATVVVTESRIDADGLARDSLDLFRYQYGVLKYVRRLDAQIAAAPPRRPTGIVLPSGALAVTLTGAGGMGVDDYVVWTDVNGWFSVAIQSLPGMGDGIAVDPSGVLVVGGHSLDSRGQLSVQATAMTPMQPPPWQFAVDVPTTTTSAPVMAMDAHGSTYLAVRTTAGTPEEPTEAAVALTKLTSEGTLAWTTTLPLAVELSRVPLALSLTLDDEPDVVLAGFVDGRLHLEQREQRCECS